jgi:hypothetical protein
MVYIGAKDSTGLTTDGAVLSLFCEGLPVADTNIMQSGDAATHKMSIWINGTEYYIALQEVT